MADRLTWVVVTAIIVAGIALPTAAGSHCETKINLYGRPAQAPVSPPPYSTMAHATCLRLLEDAVDQHTLPPNTGEVMVRIHGDFGPSVKSVDAELDGLGFIDQHYTLMRTLNPLGGYTYNLAEWIPLPNGPVDGELTVTITQPGGLKRAVTYETTVTLQLPPVPPS